MDFVIELDNPPAAAETPGAVAAVVKVAGGGGGGYNNPNLYEAPHSPHRRSRDRRATAEPVSQTAAGPGRGGSARSRRR